LLDSYIDGRDTVQISVKYEGIARFKCTLVNNVHILVVVLT
jgi:hypothetical protein